MNKNLCIEDTEGYANNDNPAVSCKNTVIDRTLQITLPSHVLSRPTPSQLCSVSLSQERQHRLYGSSLIHSASFLLRFKNPSTKCTSCSVFHRFYHRESLTHYDVWSVAMACVLIGAKIEDDIRSIKQIILVFHHLFRRRRLQLQPFHDNIANNEFPSSTLLSQNLTKTEKENLLRSFIPSLNPYSHVYREYHSVIISTEQIILRALGFTVYWIPYSHPHSFLLYFCKVLEMKEGDSAVQRSWNYCNDSSLLDLCVRYKPQVMACAAIHLAAKEADLPLPMTPRPWWQLFIGSGHEIEISIVCNALLALQNESFVDDSFHFFIPSFLSTPKADAVSQNLYSDDVTECTTEMSFNDPGSYLWNLINLEESS